MRRKMQLAAALCGLLMGTGLAATWIALGATGEVTRMLAQPWETSLLLAAEAMTGAVLIVSAIGLLRRARWAMPMILVGLGMLLYCSVFSCGVFGETGNSKGVVFFAVVAVLAAFFAASLTLRWRLER